MERIKVMVNGLPGNMSQRVADHAGKDQRFEIVPYALTGPEITEIEHQLASGPVKLIRPDDRDRMIGDVIKECGPFISIDYSHPTAINANVEFYCNNNLPFVTGTTGGDREQLEKTVRSGSVPAVIAPNMGKQIVGFQAMMAYAAENFPNLFDGYTLTIRESHQKGKADTSGTAKAMVRYFNRLGPAFAESDIEKERDPEVQKTEWNIPEDYLGGHAWHTYSLVSTDDTVKFEFTHNVNGRDVYARGTLDAVIFLNDQIRKGAGNDVFSMIDVLKNG